MGDLEIGRVTITLMRGPTVAAEIEIHPRSQELTVRERWPNGVERAVETCSLEQAITLMGEMSAARRGEETRNG
jgi:hypothetical protein